MESDLTHGKASDETLSPANVGTSMYAAPTTHGAGGFPVVFIAGYSCVRLYSSPEGTRTLKYRAGHPF